MLKVSDPYQKNCIEKVNVCVVNGTLSKDWAKQGPVVECLMKVGGSCLHHLPNRERREGEIRSSCSAAMSLLQDGIKKVD
jgi:hypothetical protein